MNGPEYQRAWDEVCRCPFLNLRDLAKRHGMTSSSLYCWVQYWHRGEIAQMQRRYQAELSAEDKKLLQERPKWGQLVALLMEKLGVTELPVQEGELKFRAGARTIWEDGVVRTFPHERALLQHFAGVIKK